MVLKTTVRNSAQRMACTEVYWMDLASALNNQVSRLYLIPDWPDRCNSPL